MNKPWPFGFLITGFILLILFALACKWMRIELRSILSEGNQSQQQSTK